MVPKNNTGFQGYIRARRRELNLSQVQLAQALGLPQAVVSALETGKREYLNYQKLSDLAQVLRVNVEELRNLMPVRGAQPGTELGKLIRKRREELNLTHLAFADKMGMSPNKARALEVGKAPAIDQEVAQQLKKVLALEIDPSALTQANTRLMVSTTELGKLVFSRRNELGMTMAMLAKELNVSRQFVHQIETGEASIIRNDEIIVRLAHSLKLDVKELEAVRLTERRSQMSTTSPLGQFLFKRRSELNLSRQKVARSGKISAYYLSSLEKGLTQPTPEVLDILAKVLDCQIPPELIQLPPSNDRKKPKYKSKQEKGLGKLVTTHQLPPQLRQAQSDLEKIKQLSDIREDAEAVRKALRILRRLLEKKADGYVFRLCKDQDIVELELIL